MKRDDPAVVKGFGIDTAPASESSEDDLSCAQLARMRRTV